MVSTKKMYPMSFFLQAHPIFTHKERLCQTDNNDKKDYDNYQTNDDDNNGVCTPRFFRAHEETSKQPTAEEASQNQRPVSIFIHFKDFSHSFLGAQKSATRGKRNQKASKLNVG